MYSYGLDIKGEFVGGAYHRKLLLWYEQHIYETMSHTSEIWILEVIFVDFRLMKNIIFNKTESFGGRNISNHACQIFCSKSYCETVYHWFFLLEITVAKIMKNLNVCSAHSYLYPQSQFKSTCIKHQSINESYMYIIMYMLWCMYSHGPDLKGHRTSNYQTSFSD